MMCFNSSVVLVVAFVAGCHGSTATAPPSADIHIAPMPRSAASAASEGESKASTTAEPAEDGPLPTPQGDTCGLLATLRATPSTGGPPTFSVTLTNKGSRPVHLVAPGDGSDAAMRTPILRFIATSGGKPAEPRPAARCGLTNAMESSEVFTLVPGASREMNDWIGQPYVKPGTYDVKLRFRNDPSLVRNATPDVGKLVAATDACDVTSNAIKVTLEAR